MGRLDSRAEVEEDLEMILEQNIKEWEVIVLELFTTTVEDGVILDCVVRKKETVWAQSATIMAKCICFILTN